MAYITITLNNSEATHAARLKSIVERSKSLLVDGQQLILESYQMFGEEGPDKFAMFATKMGIPKANAQEVFDMLNGEQNDMRGENNTGQAVALANRVG